MKPGDSSCCRGNAPYKECRCHVVERFGQWERLRAKCGSDDEAMAAWEAYLRRLRTVRGDEIIQVCDFDMRSEPHYGLLSAEQMARVRAMDEVAGITWEKTK